MLFLDICKILFGHHSLKQRDKISQEKLKRWQIEKQILEREQTILQEKEEFKQKKKEVKTPYAKKALNALLINSVIVEMGIAYVTYSSIQLAYTTGSPPDFGPLLALIPIIIGQTVSYGIYSNKAKAENVQGGIVYDLAMRNDEEAKG